MDANKKQRFEVAQKYEFAWWRNHIQTELGPTSRDWLVGYQDHVGRGHMARMNLNVDNQFWSLDQPAIQGSILDLGSGIVSFFEGKTMPVIAVEPSLGMLKEAFPDLVVIGRSRNVTYTSGEIYDIQDNAVDNVWCCNMLDHTPDWYQILTEEIPRVLKPSGRLFLSVDCREGNVKLDDGHMTAFTPPMLKRILIDRFKEIWSTENIPDVNYYRWDYIGGLKW